LPVRSQQQHKMMQAICNGDMEPPSGMTKEQACEFVRATPDASKLPKVAIEDIVEGLKLGPA